MTTQQHALENERKVEMLFKTALKQQQQPKKAMNSARERYVFK